MSDDFSLSPGTIVAGEYTIERELARGGMGSLSVARHHGSGQLRAVKTMHARLVTDDALRARFAREATVSAQIESDHVVAVLGAGVDPALGIPWMAMELLDGEDLSHAVNRRGALSAAEVAMVMSQLGHALAAAHRVGIVHRDLKAANVFLASSRRQGMPFMVKVLDFGIAKFLNLVSTRATTSAIGSPLWMAPEQTDPAKSVTPATDVWSLGLLAFYLLTGKCFWMTPSYPNASIAALLGELLMLPLPTASARAAQQGVGDRIPPGFDAWFARCIARDPAERFRDAGEATPPLLAVFQQTAHLATPPVPAPRAEAALVAGAKLGATQMLPATLHLPAVARTPATVAMSAMELTGATMSGAAMSGATSAPAPFQATSTTVTSREAPRRSSALIVGASVALTLLVAAAGVAVFKRPDAARPTGVATAVPRAAPVAIAPPLAATPTPVAPAATTPPAAPAAAPTTSAGAPIETAHRLRSGDRPSAEGPPRAERPIFGVPGFNLPVQPATGPEPAVAPTSDPASSATPHQSSRSRRMRLWRQLLRRSERPGDRKRDS